MRATALLSEHVIHPAEGIAPAARSLTHRRRLGQVATPRDIADWMTNWTCADRPRRILDPAVGEGVFVRSVVACYSRRDWKLPAIFGCEIDEALAVGVRRSGLPVELAHADFLSMRFDSPFDAILANPPYVRHHAHARDESLFRKFDGLCGERLSRMTNLYGLFLLKIWSHLAPCGRAAVIAPAEWLNADFGVPIKRRLLRENAIEAIIQFAHGSSVFDDALTTAAIILLRRGRSAGDVVRFATVTDAESLTALNLDRATGWSSAELDPARKWTPLIEGRAAAHASLRSLADVATCTRGIATGANSYFTLNESTRRRWKLDRRDLSVCITKARQVSGTVLTKADMVRLIDDDERVYLISPRAGVNAALTRYLAEGRRLGIHTRYLPSHRPEWFRPEVRSPAPILVSVFARGAFRFVLNEAGVLNLTPYHGIFPKDVAPRRVRKLFEYLNSAAAAKSLAMHRRIYGGGLLKLEPRDVESLNIPDSLYHPRNRTSR